MARQARVIVDHTHCGRHVTGLERITLELFSREALAPIDVDIVRANGVADMVVRQTLQMPLRLALDRRAILVCPGFPPAVSASLFGARALPYIHDLFLLTRPGDLNQRAKLYMAPAFRFAVRRLPRFLANSETTRDELRTFCRPDARIQLYRPDVRNIFGLDAEGRARRETSPGALRLIAMGTIEPRKNLLAAAAILAALRARGLPDATLDLVGRPGWGDDVARLAASPGVTIHGYLPLDRARDLLRDADVLISTSHDEGLGLPLLEAQYAGLPVIAPDKPVFREVLGESGLYIDPADPVGAAERIVALTTRPGWRAASVAADADNLNRWAALAARDRVETLRLLARLAGIGGPPC